MEANCEALELATERPSGNLASTPALLLYVNLDLCTVTDCDLSYPLLERPRLPPVSLHVCDDVIDGCFKERLVAGAY